MAISAFSRPAGREKAGVESGGKVVCVWKLAICNWKLEFLFIKIQTKDLNTPSANGKLTIPNTVDAVTNAATNAPS